MTPGITCYDLLSYSPAHRPERPSVLRYEGPDKGAGQLGSCLGRRDVNGIIGNVGAGNSGFHTRKNFSENYPQFGHAPSKFHQSGPDRKPLKGHRFYGAPDLLAGPVRPGPASTSCPSILAATALLFYCQSVQQCCGLRRTRWCVSVTGSRHCCSLLHVAVMNRQLRPLLMGYDAVLGATSSPICRWKIFLHNLSRRHEELKYFWSKRRAACIIAYEDMNTMHWTILKLHLVSKKWHNPSCVCSTCPITSTLKWLCPSLCLASCQRLTQRVFNTCAIVDLEMAVVVIMRSQLESNVRDEERKREFSTHQG